MPVVTKLAQVMKERNVSVKELSEKIGITEINITRIRTGRIASSRFSTLDKICDCLECQIFEIFEFVPKEKLSEKDIVCYPEEMRNTAESD